MKSLYIIGNGFDRAHNLDTSYWSFREYLDDKYPDFLVAFEHLYNIGRIDFSDLRIRKCTYERWEKAIQDTLWGEFEDKMGHPNIDEMLGSSECILQDMHLDGGLTGIEDTMDEYWREEYGFVRKFQQYVKEWIETIDTSHIVPKKKTLIDSTDYFINFNYTDLLENIYAIEDVLHIHGGVSNITDIPPVMGHCNLKEIQEHRQQLKECEEQFDEGGTSIHRAVVEYLESIYKDTDFYIREHQRFWESLKDVDPVIILGWSGGEVDLPYLRKIRDSVNENAKWTVYYYSKKDYKELRKVIYEELIKKNYKVNLISSDEFWD